MRRDQPIWLREERKADSEEVDMVVREEGEGEDALRGVSE